MILLKGGKVAETSIVELAYADQDSQSSQILLLNYGIQNCKKKNKINFYWDSKNHHIFAPAKRNNILDTILENKPKDITCVIFVTVTPDFFDAPYVTATLWRHKLFLLI